MESQANKSTHPLLLLAGIAIILFCAVGVAAIAGWIPSSIGKTDETATLPQTSKPASPATERRAATKSRADSYATRSAGAISTAAVAACAECGVVESVREIDAQGKASGAGAVGGAVVGGLVGNQMGAGRGKDVMTVVGALGGALAGNQIEKKVKSSTTYEIAVRLNDGSVRVAHESSPPAWRPGDKVKFIDGHIQSNA